ncbi:MAG: hypothetical protein ACE5HY_01200 [Candidatus Hydrothermarchaeales archaeon]
MALNNVISKIKEHLDKKDSRREEVFKTSREVRRVSTKAIRAIHKENFKEAKDLLDQAKKEVSLLKKEDKEYNFLDDSLQEYCEAVLTYTFIKKEKLPKPPELNVSPEAYVLGLADSIGELRRYILDSMRKDDFTEVEYFLDLMDEIYHEIAAFDYPTAVIPIKRKQDIARSILEKTRGEVTLALKQAELKKLSER